MPLHNLHTILYLAVGKRSLMLPWALARGDHRDGTLRSPCTALLLQPTMPAPVGTEATIPRRSLRLALNIKAFCLCRCRKILSIRRAPAQKTLLSKCPAYAQQQSV